MDQAYLPKSVLYATSAHIGGVGLDAVALETLRGLKDQLGLAIAYGLRTSSTGEQFSTADAWLSQRHLVKNLSWHPVRLLSNLQSRYYYVAKKRAVDSVAAKSLRTGRFDLFHGWSGEALQSLHAAKSLGIPTLLEIPTWHRQKGKTLPPKTEQELADLSENVKLLGFTKDICLLSSRPFRGWFSSFLCAHCAPSRRS